MLFFFLGCCIALLSLMLAKNLPLTLQRREVQSLSPVYISRCYTTFNKDFFEEDKKLVKTTTAMKIDGGYFEIKKFEVIITKPIDASKLEQKEPEIDVEIDGLDLVVVDKRALPIPVMKIDLIIKSGNIFRSILHDPLIIFNEHKNHNCIPCNFKNFSTDDGIIYIQRTYLTNQNLPNMIVLQGTSCL